MKKVSLMILLFTTTIGFSQDMSVIKGGFHNLSDQKEVNVEFNYSDLKLLKENLTESQYVQNRKNELNGKTRGVGDNWQKIWEGAKQGIWQPKFLELMSATITKKKDILFQEGLGSAKYTLEVYVLWIYPGWDAGIMKQPAKVTTLLKVVETANRKNVLIEVSSEHAPGNQFGNNFSNESRIGEGFAKTAKSFGKMLASEIK